MKILFVFLVALNTGIYLYNNFFLISETGGLPDADEMINPESLSLFSNEGDKFENEMHCLRIGPFVTDASISIGRRLLYHNGYGLVKQKTSFREMRFYQVEAGPFLSYMEWNTAKSDLENLGFSVSYTDSGSYDFLILDRFTQRKTAEEFLHNFSYHKIPAIIKVKIYNLGPFHWLEVPDVITKERFRELSQLDWSDPLAQPTPIECTNET